MIHSTRFHPLWDRHLGPERAGKTSFLDYLEWNILNDEQPTSPTLDIKRRNHIVLKLGQNGNLVLRIRRPFDVPGDVSPRLQVNYVKHYWPAGVILVLDANSPLEGPAVNSSINWLNRFCYHFDAAIKTEPKLARTVKIIVVAMNKRDKLSDEARKRDRERFEEEVMKIVHEKLDFFRSSGQGNAVLVRPCVAIRSKIGVDYINDIIITIAKTFSR